MPQSFERGQNRGISAGRPAPGRVYARRSIGRKPRALARAELRLACGATDNQIGRGSNPTKMSSRRALSVAALVLPLALHAQSSTPAAGSLGFYRFPSVHGQTIVFGAEGDLWSVPL